MATPTKESLSKKIAAIEQQQFQMVNDFQAGYCQLVGAKNQLRVQLADLDKPEPSPAPQPTTPVPAVDAGKME